mgnify:CR=1 FL=1
MLLCGEEEMLIYHQRISGFYKYILYGIKANIIQERRAKTVSSIESSFNKERISSIISTISMSVAVMLAFLFGEETDYFVVRIQKSKA